MRSVVQILVYHSIYVNTCWCKLSDSRGLFQNIVTALVMIGVSFELFIYFRSRHANESAEIIDNIEYNDLVFVLIII